MIGLCSNQRKPQPGGSSGFADCRQWAAVGYSSQHVPNSVERIHKVHAASNTPSGLSFEVLVLSSLQGNDGPLISGLNKPKFLVLKGNMATIAMRD